MSLYKDRAEYLQAALERLIDAVESFHDDVLYNGYRARRDLDDEIEKAKRALKDSEHYGGSTE